MEQAVGRMGTVSIGQCRRQQEAIARSSRQREERSKMPGRTRNQK